MLAVLHVRQKRRELQLKRMEEELKRLREAYARGYSAYFAENLPDHGLPARFTVHVVDVPDQAASYEFYSVGLLQRQK